MDSDAINVSRLTRQEKIAINRLIFNATSEYIELPGKRHQMNTFGAFTQFNAMIEEEGLLENRSSTDGNKWIYRASFKVKP
jgi:hypothetical protein